MAAYTLTRNTPVMMTDARTESRFILSPTAAAHGVRSGMSVVIPMHEQPFGVLGAETDSPRSFSKNDVHFLQAVAHILGAAIDRNRADHKLQHGQRLESVGRLAGGISHDFNNLLMVIVAHCDFLGSRLEGDAEALAEVTEIEGAATRAASLTRQLLAFSSRQVLEPKVLNVNETVTEVEKMLRRLIGTDIELGITLDPALQPVLADPGQLEQVIVNLIVNARDAMPAGGAISITTENIDLRAFSTGTLDTVHTGPHVVLRVSDTGSGMDRETQARIFEPFFTTKGPERGTGLGLATVYGIVKQSRGAITVSSELGQGTTFSIYLPVSTAAPALATRGSRNLGAASHGTETILLVEDEPNVRVLLARVLRSLGYHVIEAMDGEAALAASAAHAGSIDLLVSDIVMPRMHGGALARALRVERPALRVLHVSGHADPQVVDDGLLDAGASFLQKPFTADAIGRKLRDMLDR
jgi:signal transduction histidine kinase/CheY-like chemotaxis protein